MVWFVNLERLDTCDDSPPLLDEIDENSPAVAAKVLFCPEILDKVFRSLSTETLFSARSVCQKWHSISSISLKRRLDSGKPETRSIFYLKSLNKPQDYCSRWLRLDFKDEEPRTSGGHHISSPAYRQCFDEEDESIGISIEGRTCSVNRHHQRALAILELVPSFEWISLITVLQVHDSLAVQDWIKVEGALLSTLKSLKCMHLDLVWQPWTPEDSQVMTSKRNISQESHKAMREIYLTYPWESWSPEDGAPAAEFEQRFIRMCPKLQVLCSNRQSIVKLKPCIHQNCLNCCHTKTVASYDAMFKREEYLTTWDITFQYQAFDHLQPPTAETVRRDLEAMFDQVPIGILRCNAQANIDCVSTIVSSSCSAALKRLEINTVLLLRGAYGYVAQQLRNWSNNPAFSTVRTLVLTFGEIERAITEVDFLPVEHNEGFGFASSLSNVNRVEVGGFCMDYNAWGLETLDECQSRDLTVARYWAGVLQFTPNVELLVFGGRARTLWSLAKRLAKLKHIVFQCLNPQDTFVNRHEVFETEIDSIIWGLQELQSFTLDFEPKSRFWDKMQVSKRARALLNACNAREHTILVQINSKTLQRAHVDLMLSHNSKTVVQGFHEKHGELYQTVKDDPFDAFSWNAGGLVFVLSPKLNPVYQVQRIP